MFYFIKLQSSLFINSNKNLNKLDIIKEVCNIPHRGNAEKKVLYLLPYSVVWLVRR